jgi:hypothetical protein
MIPYTVLSGTFKLFFSYVSVTSHDFHRYLPVLDRFSVGEFDYGSLDLKVGKFGSLDLKLTDFAHTRYIANRMRTTHRKDGGGRGGGGVAHSLTGQSQPHHPLSVLLYKDAVTR